MDQLYSELHCTNIAIEESLRSKFGDDIANAYQLYNTEYITTPYDVVQQLEAWNCNARIILISSEKLSDLNKPFIVHLINEQNSFAFIKETGDEYITYLDHTSSEITLPMSDFKKIWMGCCIEITGINLTKDESLISEKKLHYETRITDYKKNVRLIPDFLSSSECEDLIDYAENNFQPSMVDGRVVSPIRTSSTVMLHDNDLTKSLHIKDRIAKLVGGIDIGKIEFLQCVRYNSGEHYGAHMDTDVKNINSPSRIKTGLIYLNDDFSGGATQFPELDLKIDPRKGALLLFDLVDSEGKPDRLSIHKGNPVDQGTKYALNVWIRDVAS